MNVSCSENLTNLKQLALDRNIVYPPDISARALCDLINNRMPSEESLQNPAQDAASVFEMPPFPPTFQQDSESVSNKGQGTPSVFEMPLFPPTFQQKGESDTSKLPSINSFDSRAKMIKREANKKKRVRQETSSEIKSSNVVIDANANLVAAVKNVTTGRGQKFAFNLEDLYDIDATPLGAGGFGTVFRAVKKSNGNIYALKLLKRINDASEREIAILKTYSQSKEVSPHIVRYYAKLDANYKNEPYHVIEMEFVDGVNLKEWFRMHNGKPSQKQLCSVLVSALEALASIHRAHILHLDVKPENIVVRRGTNQAVLVDFGLACLSRATTDAEETAIGCSNVKSAGTPSYFSPDRLEFCAGKNQIACTNETLQKDDVWALGFSFYKQLNAEDYRKNVSEKIGNSLDNKSFNVVANILRQKTWANANDLFPQNAKLDTLLRDMLVRDDANRKSADQLLVEAKAICN